MSSIIIYGDSSSLKRITHFMCLLAAVLDEYSQSFLFRTSKVSDVLIDFGGAIVGMVAYYGF
jgi:VanZ family protein